MYRPHLLVLSDCHGNISQYDQIFSYAERQSCIGVVHCGDIGPRLNASTKDQREFLKEYFFAKTELLKQKRGSDFPIYAMMGNSDHRANELYFWKEQTTNLGQDRYRCIDGKIIQFGNLFISGYSYIPPTPFGHKEGERRDEKVEGIDRGEYILEGESTTPEGSMTSVNLSTLPTIKQELSGLFSNHKNLCKTIFICHAPPFGTNLDCHRSGAHVGSADISEVLKKKKFLYTFHGHVHETVKMSGRFQDQVGKNKAYTVGNNPQADNPFVLLLELPHRGDGTKGKVSRGQLVNAKFVYG